MRKSWAGCAAVLAACAAIAGGCSSKASPADAPGVDDTPDGAVTNASPSTDAAAYDVAPSPDSGLGVLLFRPDTLYSGFDGTHTFKVPIAVYDGASDLEVTASDSSAVSIAPVELETPVLPDGTSDNGRYFMLTVNRPGEVTLTARSQGRSTRATLTALSYAAGRWVAGEARYTQGAGGTQQPCTNCHVNGQAIDHSPASMGSVDDAVLATAISQGITPNNFPITGVAGGHRWKVTGTELDGLVTYLRALEPRGFK